MPVPHVRPLLFASGSEAGRINPLLTIAAELARGDGTELVFASTDDRRADIEALAPGQVRFASLGEPDARHLPRNWDEAIFTAMTGPSRGRAAAEYLGRVIDADYLQDMYDRTLKVLDEVEPALVVVDQDAPYVMDAALARGVPYVMSVPIPVSVVYAERVPADFPKAFTGLPRNMTPAQLEENARFERELGEALTASGKLGEFFKARLAGGFRNPACVSSAYADEAVSVLGFSVFGVEYEFPDVPENVRMIGAVVPEPSGERTALTGWLDDHESIVYIGFGTIMRPTAGQVGGIVEAVRRLPPGQHVLWRLPASHHHLLPPDLPANLRIESWLPSQTEVLAHPNVKVFFNHGGGNAVSEAGYYGKPMLVMPFWMDCHDWAARVVDCGAGLAVRYTPELDPAEIAERLTSLLTDERFASRAAYWRDRLRAAGGVGAAVEIIEKHVAEQAARD
ncbi:glycosyltransferase [Amycolatopsis sp. NPDC004747]